MASMMTSILRLFVDFVFMRIVTFKIRLSDMYVGSVTLFTNTF